MRSGEAFVLGTIAGAAVVWLWGREIGAYTAESTRGIRARAAEGLHVVEETAAAVVGGALRAAQTAIRPPPATGTA
jgi:hypothetical protein